MYIRVYVLYIGTRVCATWRCNSYSAAREPHNVSDPVDYAIYLYPYIHICIHTCIHKYELYRNTLVYSGVTCDAGKTVIVCNEKVELALDHTAEHLDPRMVLVVESISAVSCVNIVRHGLFRLVPRTCFTYVCTNP